MHPLLRSAITATAMISLCLVLLVSGLSPGQAEAGTPTLNGRFYGDGDDSNYYFIGSSTTGRGELYYYMDRDTLYLAVVVSDSVNDNVTGWWGPGSPDPEISFL